LERHQFTKVPWLWRTRLREATRVSTYKLALLLLHRHWAGNGRNSSSNISLPSLGTPPPDERAQRLPEPLLGQLRSIGNHRPGWAYRARRAAGGKLSSARSLRCPRPATITAREMSFRRSLPAAGPRPPPPPAISLRQ